MFSALQCDQVKEGAAAFIPASPGQMAAAHPLADGAGLDAAQLCGVGYVHESIGTGDLHFAALGLKADSSLTREHTCNFRRATTIRLVCQQRTRTRAPWPPSRPHRLLSFS